MRLTRVHCDAPLAPGGEATLPGAAAAHVTSRAAAASRRRGWRSSMATGQRAITSRIAAFDRGAVRVRVAGAASPRAPESPLAVTLVQGISRGERMDWACRRRPSSASRAIAPVLRRAQRRAPRRATRPGRKLAHWQAIVVAACEQCGRARIPAVADPRPLEDFPGRPAARRRAAAALARRAGLARGRRAGRGVDRAAGRSRGRAGGRGTAGGDRGRLAHLPSRAARASQRNRRDRGGRGACSRWRETSASLRRR